MPFHTSMAALQKIAQRISGVFKRKLLYELFKLENSNPSHTHRYASFHILRAYLCTYFNRKIFLK